MTENIFKRSDMYRLSNFILCGTDSADVYGIYQKDIEKESFKDLNQKLEKCIGNDTEQIENIINIINEYNMIITDLYFMNGMKVGARIIEQLLSDS